MIIAPTRLDADGVLHFRCPICRMTGLIELRMIDVCEHFDGILPGDQEPVAQFKTGDSKP